MAAVKRFEELICWQKARELNLELSPIVELLKRKGDFRFGEQVCSAGLSTLANIAEGFDRRTIGQFSHFLTIAKGSCAEVRSYVYVLLDEKLIDQEKSRSLISRCEEISRIIEGLKRSIAHSPESHDNVKEGIAEYSSEHCVADIELQVLDFEL